MHSETESEEEDSEEIYTGGHRDEFHNHPINTPSESDQSMVSEPEEDDGSSYREESLKGKKTEKTK